MLKRGKKLHAKLHTNPCLSKEEIWQRKHRNPCLDQQEILQVKSKACTRILQVHPHPVLKLLQVNLDGNDQMVGLDLPFLWHDITRVSKPMKSKTSLDTTNNKLRIVTSTAASNANFVRFLLRELVEKQVLSKSWHGQNWHSGGFDD